MTYWVASETRVPASPAPTIKVAVYFQRYDAAEEIYRWDRAMCLFVPVCMDVCMCVCVCVSMYVYGCLCVFVCTRLCVFVCVPVRVRHFSLDIDWAGQSPRAIVFEFHSDIDRKDMAIQLRRRLGVLMHITTITVYCY